jgi:hypothetical protein
LTDRSRSDDYGKNNNNNKITISKRNLILSLIVILSLSAVLLSSGQLSLMSVTTLRAAAPSSSGSPTTSSSAPSPTSSSPSSPSSRAPTSAAPSTSPYAGSSPTTSSSPTSGSGTTTTPGNSGSNSHGGPPGKTGGNPGQSGSNPGQSGGTSPPPGQGGNTPGQCQGPVQKLCSGQCKNIVSDPANCGDCGKECIIGQSCVNGQCQCPSGQDSICNGVCTDTQNDALNCGVCGNRCTGVCAGAKCVQCTNDLQCPTTRPFCDNNNICVECKSSADCRCKGPDCPPDSGLSCKGGLCVEDCAPGETLCDRTCVDTKTDNFNCGGCTGIEDHICHGLSSCIGGQCQCPSGQTLCGNPAECVDLNTNSNCGDCGNNCNNSPNPIGSSCQSSSCQCPADKPDVCGGLCVNKQTDNDHCGDLCLSCPTSLGQTCQNGSCQCPAGQEPDPVTGQCQNQCPSGQHFDSTTGKCVQCTSNEQCGGSFIGGAHGVCSLAPNTAYTNTCIGCNGDFTCSPGEFCDGSSGLCCPGGTLPSGGHIYKVCDSPQGRGCFNTATDVHHCGQCPIDCTGATFPDCRSNSPQCQANPSMPGCTGRCTQCLNGECAL